MSKTGPQKDGAAEGKAKRRRKTDETSAPGATDPAPEIGGRKGPDPTRYGDWEKNGRCIDF